MHVASRMSRLGTESAFEVLARARALIGAAASMADYLFTSLDDARALSGLEEPDALIDWAHRLGAKNVLLMCGAEGAILA